MRRKIDYRLFKKFRDSRIRLEIKGKGLILDGKFKDLIKIIIIATRRGDLGRTSNEMDGAK